MPLTVTGQLDEAQAKKNDELGLIQKFLENVHSMVDESRYLERPEPRGYTYWMVYWVPASGPDQKPKVRAEIALKEHRELLLGVLEKLGYQLEGNLIVP
jgi:hypothetical protein